jgi:dihydrofolate reductase
MSDLGGESACWLHLVCEVCGAMTDDLDTHECPSAADDFGRQSQSEEQRHEPGDHRMRNLVVQTFLTLDGVMQAPGGPEEDPTGGFRHGGWSVNYWDDVMAQRMAQQMDVPFALLLGRKTYEIFAAHWPHVSDEERAARGGTSSDVEDEAAAALNSATKYVASTTRDNVEWTNSVLLRGDVAEAVAELKRQDGPEIQVHGSGDLIQTLLAHDLVDVYRLWFFPLVLGTGKRLFADGAIPAGLRLVDSQTSTTGVIMTTFERAGDIDYGAFTFDVPTEEEVERRRKLADA